MPTAWELLIENSSATDGSTAWEHLNAQEGGGAAGDVYIAEMVTIVDDDKVFSIYDIDGLIFVEDNDDVSLIELNDEELNVIINDEIEVVEL